MMPMNFWVKQTWSSLPVMRDHSFVHSDIYWMPTMYATAIVLGTGARAVNKLGRFPACRKLAF